MLPDTHPHSTECTTVRIAQIFQCHGMAQAGPERSMRLFTRQASRTPPNPNPSSLRDAPKYMRARAALKRIATKWQHTSAIAAKRPRDF